MYLDVHKELENKMKKTILVFKDELGTIRAGRANPAMLDRIKVDYYGAMTPLKQLANVSAPEPRQLVIQPWDNNALSDIERAIIKSDLGINPSNDGKIIRLIIPQLTEQRRKELAKLIKKISEDAKVAIRNERRNANDDLKKMEKNGELTEDHLRRAEEKVQELTDRYTKEVDNITQDKENELTEV